MKERILAVLAAVALVLLAVFVRGQLVDSNDDNGGGKKNGGSAASELPVVVCAPDLAEVCTTLAAQGAIKAAPTLDLDRAGVPAELKGIDGWITWSPAPEIAELDDDTDLWGEETVLGTAALGVLADPSTLDCGNPVDWACLAEKASPEFPVGVGEVTTSDGLARLAPLAPSLARDGYATDVDTERGQAILTGPNGGQDDAASMLLLASRPGALAAVVAPLPALERSADKEQVRNRGLRALPAEPATRAAVVLVGRKPDLAGVAASATTGAAAVALTEIGVGPGGAPPKVDPGALWQLRDQLG